MESLRDRLKIDAGRLDEVNAFILDPNNPMIGRLLDIVERFGGPEAINAKAAEARKLENLLERLKETGSSYYDDLQWLMRQRDEGAFVRLEDWRKDVLGEEKAGEAVNEDNAVTLEISALQFFPWLMSQARRAIERRELMPGRYIRVRNMAEQSRDHGDILAVAAAMQIVGASYVETLDTKGTDGSNVHLGGPETITGYFGGVGQPNDHPYKWIEEYLRYYTEYGIRQVLNVNQGTILAGYMLHKLGIDNEFKISVYMGNDNPFSVLWTLMTARLLSREDGTTSLIGFNFSNSVNADTIREAGRIRKALGLERVVRFEHHITETYKSIVVQPYLRRDELVEVAAEVPNISAKHEGADPDIDVTREHPSDILDYFISKEDIEKQGIYEAMENNYLDKHEALNRTARALAEAGIGFVCAKNLHK